MIPISEVVGETLTLNIRNSLMSTTLCLSNYFLFLILLDLIGVFTGVGSERGLERNGTMTKLNVIELKAGR